MIANIKFHGHYRVIEIQTRIYGSPSATVISTRIHNLDNYIVPTTITVTIVQPEPPSTRAIDCKATINSAGLYSNIKPVPITTKESKLRE